MAAGHKKGGAKPHLLVGQMASFAGHLPYKCSAQGSVGALCTIPVDGGLEEAVGDGSS